MIVASILLAFAIDAGWDARAERTQEQALLHGLAEDFGAAAKQLEGTRRLHQSKIDAAEQLLGWADREGTIQVYDDSVDIAIRQIMSRGSFDPPMGTLATLLGSGRLDVLQNTDLVKELTQWSSIVEDMREEEDIARQYVFDTFIPYVSTRLNLKDTEVAPEAAGLVQWPGDRDPSGSPALLSDTQFQSHVFMAWAIERVVFNDMEPVEESVRRILGLLADEIDTEP